MYLRPGEQVKQRDGDWLQTYSGVQFFPWDPREEDIVIEDIAHALSNIPRFTGHTTHFYSVAQHSVLVSMYCGPEDALWGLLHDASEAYLVDLPSPIKRDPRMAAYREAEQRLQRCIARKFGLPEEMPASVKRADMLLLSTEATQLMGPRPAPWREMPDPLQVPLHPVTQEMAEIRFLGWFEKLTAGAL